ncbi:MAG: hypothetical protein Kow0081_4650 [Candidatus Dojkabacteria bacterium]
MGSPEQGGAPSPEQQKQERLQKKIEALRPRLEAAGKRLQRAQEKIQEFAKKHNLQELAQRAQQGDPEAAKLIERFQELKREMTEAMMEMYKALKQLREAFASEGMEEQFDNGPQGEQLRKIEEQLNAQEG